MLIIHSDQVKASRDFVETYGDKCGVLNWYKDEKAVAIYQMANYPNPSVFPSVFDPSSRILVGEPLTLLDAHRAVQGMDEDTILTTRIIQVKAKTKELIMAGFIHVKSGVDYLFPLSEMDQLGFTAKVNAYVTGDFPLNEDESTPPYPFLNITEYRTVYREGMVHVETMRATGHAIEDNLAGMTYQERLDFVDPRS